MSDTTALVVYTRGSRHRFPAARTYTVDMDGNLNIFDGERLTATFQRVFWSAVQYEPGVAA